jgi:GT2 family glycosyltransferase
MPVYNVSPVWLIKAYESLTAQWYSNWELCICDDASTNEETLLCLSQLAEKDARVKVKYSNENGNISVASNVALNLAEGEYVALMDNDDELTVDALYEVVKSLQHHKYSFIYSDEDKIELNGDFVDPHFKPDFNPDMFMSHNYISHLGVVEKSLIRKIGGWRKGYEGAQDYDLYLRLLEISLDILHIPKVLYHWRKIPGSTAAEFNGKSYAQEAGRKALEDAVKRRNLDAVVINGKTAGTYRVKYEIKNNPLVSVIIPFRDKPKLLRLCLSSIFDHDSYNNLQIICMDNASVDPEIVRVKEKYKGNPRVEFYSYPYEFNYSAINNYAVNNYAKGEYIIFLNNDIEITQDEWIQAMLELAQTEQAGAVGTMLLYPDDTVQHAGLITSSDSGHAIISAFKNFSARHNGYFSRLQCICNYSAVTAAMMMIKKSKFEEVGGFDEERLPIAYNDVDLCLKLIDKGYRNIYTPYCSAYHHESASRGFDDSLEKVNRQRRELNIMKQKHRSKFRKVDPSYSPNLTQLASTFTVSGRNSVDYDKFEPKCFEQNIIIKRKFSDFSSKNICLFSHYDKFGEIDPYVLYYLNALKQHFDVIFISTADLKSSELEKVADLVNIGVVKENYGYDFGAWKSGIEIINDLGLEVDQLLLCNDSVYGPINDFNKLVNDLSSSEFDVTSLTDSFEIDYHLQSYFIHCKSNVVRSEIFSSFWREFKIVEDKTELIVRNEIGLSRSLIDEGFVLGAIAPAEQLGYVNNSHLNWWKVVSEYEAGFVKVDLLRNNPASADISNWDKKLNSISKYPCSLIENHLQRTSA